MKTNLYQRKLEKFGIKKLNTKSAELLEILNKFEFYGKRACFYLKPVYKILCFVVAGLIKAETKHS